MTTDTHPAARLQVGQIFCRQCQHLLAHDLESTAGDIKTGQRPDEGMLHHDLPRQPLTAGFRALRRGLHGNHLPDQQITGAALFAIA